MSTRRMPKPESDAGPLLGALFRHARREAIVAAESAVAKAGFHGVREAHFAITQRLWDLPRGARLTDLADYSGVTKQSMSALVDDLEAAGYLERVADPDDGRARVVRFTARGRKLAVVLRGAVRNVEADWAQRVGTARLETLRATMKLLTGK